MIELIGIHRFEKGHLVDDLSEVGQPVGDPSTGVTALLETGLGTKQFRCPLNKSEAFALEKGFRRFLPMKFLQKRLVIKKF